MFFRILVVFVLFSSWLHGVEPDFYVWNRRNDARIRKSVEEYYRSSSGHLYFLAGELEDNGKIYSSGPSEYTDLTRSVPVIRIHIRHMKKNVSRLAGEVISLYSPWKASGALQIDLDAPESRILYYRDLMKELRRRLPGVKLSATVLPCHLKHVKEFRSLAENCDFYVLQVHCLTADNHDNYYILDEETARAALVRAKKLKLPFKTALPIYCCSVSSGRVVTPDLHLVSELAKESPGVIGFRLGTPGDGESLSVVTALRICRGEGYAPKVEIRWEKQKNGAWHLIIFNNGYFAENKTFHCHWKVRPGLFSRGVFNGAILLYEMNILKLRLPPSGESKVYLWLRTKSKHPAEDVQLTLEKQVEK